MSTINSAISIAPPAPPEDSIDPRVTTDIERRRKAVRKALKAELNRLGHTVEWRNEYDDFSGVDGYQVTVEVRESGGTGKWKTVNDTRQWVQTPIYLSVCYHSKYREKRRYFKERKAGIDIKGVAKGLDQYIKDHLKELQAERDRRQQERDATAAVKRLKDKYKRLTDDYSVRIHTTDRYSYYSGRGGDIMIQVRVTTEQQADDILHFLDHETIYGQDDTNNNNNG